MARNLVVRLINNSLIDMIILLFIVSPAFAGDAITIGNDGEEVRASAVPAVNESKKSLNSSVKATSAGGKALSSFGKLTGSSELKVLGRAAQGAGSALKSIDAGTSCVLGGDGASSACGNAIEHGAKTVKNVAEGVDDLRKWSGVPEIKLVKPFARGVDAFGAGNSLFQASQATNVNEVFGYGFDALEKSGDIALGVANPPAAALKGLADSVCDFVSGKTCLKASQEARAEQVQQIYEQTGCFEDYSLYGGSYGVCDDAKVKEIEEREARSKEFEALRQKNVQAAQERQYQQPAISSSADDGAAELINGLFGIYNAVLVNEQARTNRQVGQQTSYTPQLPADDAILRPMQVITNQTPYGARNASTLNYEKCPLCSAGVNCGCK